MGRSYQQACALALALDHVGERWTLLIVRELLVAPRRYSELRDSLPGIATNLLADRLRDLETAGIVRARSDEGATFYELTETGRELEPAVLALVRWGGRWLADVPPDATWRPHWLVVALRALFPPTVSDDLPVTEVRVEGTAVHLRADDGTLVVGLGPADRPELVLTTDAETVMGIAAGVVDLDDAVSARKVAVAGRTTDLRRLRRAIRAGGGS